MMTNLKVSKRHSKCNKPKRRDTRVYIELITNQEIYLFSFVPIRYKCLYDDILPGKSLLL